jgi:hypothetical protein
MHMLHFDIVPLHNDALLVSFNELLYPFEKEAFRLFTKPRLHRTCATRANVSRRSSLLKASTLCMCWSVRYVGFHPLHLFFPP